MFNTNNRFNQQKLYHIYSQHGTHTVFVIFIILSILCISFGIIIIVASDSIREVTIRYDNVNKYTYVNGSEGVYPVNFDFNGTKYSTGVMTRVNFSIAKTMSAPIMIQYGLTNFYQNHLRYAQSLDERQLQGGKTALTSKCSPFRYPGEFKNESADGHYSPCGAIAWSLFNDTISLYKAPENLICDGGAFDANGVSLIDENQCQKENIALRSEVRIRRNSPDVTNNPLPMWTSRGDRSSSNPYLKDGYYFGEAGHKIPSITDEDFVVWSSVAYLPSFYNNYRIVNIDLEAGDYYLKIFEQYDTVSFSGKKYVRLVLYNWMGQRHYILGILLLILGGILFVDSLAVLMLKYV